MAQVMIWWLLIQVVGWLALPLSYRLCRWLPDRGYTFSKSVGLLLVSYVLWLGAMLRVLQNSSGGIVLAVILAATISSWVYLKYRRGHGDQETLSAFLRRSRSFILTVELLFVVALFGWAALRGFAVDRIMPAGGEKFMEIAFLNGILNSPQFPPLDPWLSQFAISYYYFGYVMMALLTRLSGAEPGVGFDLYNALLFALTAIGAFGLIYNWVALSGRPHRDKESEVSLHTRPPLYYGLLGSLFVAIIGNLEGFLEALYARGIGSEAFWRWLDIPDLVERAAVTGSWYPGHGWWWWRASRVLQDRDLLYQPVALNAITEFPFFSFLLGDNHPHVLALPFVLLNIALALNLLLGTVRRGQISEQGGGWFGILVPAFAGQRWLYVLYGLILGALGFLNTWDLPIYLGLTTLAYGIGRYAVAGRVSGDLIRQTMVLGAALLVAAVLPYLLFYVTFSSQAGGVLPYLMPPTRLPQYLVMFGLFIFIIAGFLFCLLFQKAGRISVKALLKTTGIWWVTVVLGAGLIPFTIYILTLLNPQKRRLVQGWLASLSATDEWSGTALITFLSPRLQDPWLLLGLSGLIALAGAGVAWQVREPTKPPEGTKLQAGNLFALLLIFIGLALTLSVELVYLQDHFGVRLNTVFKFYFQGWLLLGCASAYCVWWLLNRTGRLTKFFYVFGTAVLVAAGLVYPVMALYSRTHGFQGAFHLDATANIARENPGDWAAVHWLRENVIGAPTILEAPGRSYNYEGRISAFTGLPAVLGWSYHEGQWRGNYTEQGKREPDIATIYTTSDPRLALDLLRKWQVRYVVVGEPERRYVDELCHETGRSCNPDNALGKFPLFLHPVFERDQITIYRVPD